MAKAVQTPGAAVKAQAAAYNLSITQLAEGIKISPSAARLLINNKLRISVPFAQRLSKYFGKTPEYWINLQTAYELSELTSDKKNVAVLKSISKAVKKAPPAKKVAAKKATAKKAPAKKAAAKKVTAKKGAAKKVAVKKAPVKKVAAKKAAPKAKAPVKKAVAKPAPKPVTPAPVSSWTPSSDQ